MRPVQQVACTAILCAAWIVGAATPSWGGAATPKHVVMIAGTKSHPVGQHEYLRTIKLLKYLLEHSPNLSGIVADTYFDGWPKDPHVLESADAIVTMGDSGDYVKDSRPVSFYTNERIAIMERAMRRGAGLVTLHSATFAPSAYARQIQDWSGGYFDWQGGNTEGGFYGSAVDEHTRMWHSIVRTEQAEAILPSPEHPIANGVQPFAIFDEFYYQLRFPAADGWRPIISVPRFATAPADQVVAWALQRPGAGGRGFGFTAGHFYANWRNDDFRKLILNAIVWSAGLPVPAGGVESRFATDDEVNHAEMVQPLPTLIVGDGEDSEQFTTTLAPAIIAALNSEVPRFATTLSAAPAPLAGDLSKYRLVVLANCGALKADAGDRRLAGLRRYLDRGGGMVIVYAPPATAVGTPPGAAEDTASSNSLARLCKSVRWGRTTDHSSVADNGWAQTMIDMRVADLIHPAMRGQFDRRIEKWETDFPVDFDMPLDPDMHVLASARSIDTGRDNPMAFTSALGRARVSQVVAGEIRMLDVGGKNATPLWMPNLSSLTTGLMRRGSLWAAGESE